MTDLIALYSPFPQSGKSTLADSFIQQDPSAVRIKFADAMRDVVVPFAAPFVEGGEQEVRAWLEDGRKDQYVIPGLGVTLRHLLQTIGTWGRTQVHDAIWVMLAELRIDAAYDEGKRVIVDDLRYENEYDMLEGLGAYLIRVERKDPPLTPPHESNDRLSAHRFDELAYNARDFDAWKATAARRAKWLWPVAR